MRVVCPPPPRPLLSCAIPTQTLIFPAGREITTLRAVASSLNGWLYALQGLGYTDEDSAGQQNIFAVEVGVHACAPSLLVCQSDGSLPHDPCAPCSRGSTSQAA